MMNYTLSTTDTSSITMSEYSGTEDEFDTVFTSVNLASLATDPACNPRTRDEFRHLLASGQREGHCFVLRDGCNLIGSAVISPSFLGVGDVYKVYAISDFAILPKYQGRGYGRKALLCMISYIREHMKNKDVGLGVAQSNSKAVALYKSIGFEIICNANLASDDRPIVGYQMLLKESVQLKPCQCCGSAV